MFEIRSIIGDIEEMKQRAAAAGARLLDYYSFRDVIFVPKSEKVNLNVRTIRLRVSSVSTQPKEKVLVAEKKTLWFERSKTDQIVLQEAFGSEHEARLFIAFHYYSSLRAGLEYSREGWKYELEDGYLFLENIQIPGFPPTIEIEAETENKLSEYRERLGIGEVSFYSVPEMVRRHLLAPSDKPKE